MERSRKDLVELAVTSRLYLESVASVELDMDGDELKETIAKNKTAFEMFKATSTRVNMAIMDDTLDGAHKYKEELRRRTQKLETQTKTRLANESNEKS